jgi:hypothetical protein
MSDEKLSVKALYRVCNEEAPFSPDRDTHKEENDSTLSFLNT